MSPLSKACGADLHEELAAPPSKGVFVSRSATSSMAWKKPRPRMSPTASMSGKGIGQHGRERAGHWRARAPPASRAATMLLHGNARRAAGGMAGEGVPRHRRAMLAMDRIGHLVGIDRGAQRQVTGGKALGHRHDVGLDAVMLQRPPGAGAARAAHHLVRDHQHAMAVADLAHPLRIARGRRHAAARRTHHGLEDEGADLLRPHAAGSRPRVPSRRLRQPSRPSRPQRGDRHWRAKGARRRAASPRRRVLRSRKPETDSAPSVLPCHDRSRAMKRRRLISPRAA